MGRDASSYPPRWFFDCLEVAGKRKIGYSLRRFGLPEEGPVAGKDKNSYPLRLFCLLNRRSCHRKEGSSHRKG